MAPQLKDPVVQDILSTDRVVPLPATVGVKDNQNNSKSEEYKVKHTAVIEAASAEIAELITSQGAVGTAQCLDIIQAKAAINAQALKHFPRAMTSATILAKVAPALEKRGYNDDNVLYGQSVCPDEINHEAGDITNLMADHWGEVFHMGGLAGIPFTGSTGFAAFSHHVPDGGHCFVLMAPHIGLDQESTLGKYSRIGQCGPAGTACGAAVGAYRHCCDGKPLPDLATCPNDYQMAFLMHQIQKHTTKIKAAGGENAQQACLANTTHDIAKTMLDQMVNVDFGGSDNSTLVILTGIQINMPPPFEDYFEPKSFYIMTKQGEVIDLMEETFGNSSFENQTSAMDNLVRETSAVSIKYDDDLEDC